MGAIQKVTGRQSFRGRLTTVSNAMPTMQHKARIIAPTIGLRLGNSQWASRTNARPNSPPSMSPGLNMYPSNSCMFETHFRIRPTCCTEKMKMCRCDTRWRVLGKSVDYHCLPEGEHAFSTLVKTPQTLQAHHSRAMLESRPQLVNTSCAPARSARLTVRGWLHQLPFWIACTL